MSRSICSVEGCAKEVHAHGLCPMHNWRHRTHGDVNVCTTNRYVPMEERFWMKVQKGPGCWNWTASTRNGYGRFTPHRGGKSYRAHRFAYELVVGPIPEGMLLDHKCHNTLCVNPSQHYGGSFKTVEEAAEAARQLRLALYTYNDADRRTA